MKKLMIFLFLSISLWGCEVMPTRMPAGRAEVAFLKGKKIYQVFTSSNNAEVTILFTDTTSVILSSDCWMYMKKQ